jgi:hypothetical protein
MINIEGCDSPEAMTETICLSIALLGGIAQQDVTSHEKVVAETVTKSRNMRDTASRRATRDDEKYL